MVKLQLNDIDNQCHCNWITGCISSNNKVIFVRWDFPSFFPRCHTLHGQTIISLSFFSLPPFVRKQFPSRLHTCFIASWNVKFTKSYQRPIRAKVILSYSVMIKRFTHDKMIKYLTVIVLPQGPLYTSIKEGEVVDQHWQRFREPGSRRITKVWEFIFPKKNFS